jgi:hypothetical protein
MKTRMSVGLLTAGFLGFGAIAAGSVEAALLPGFMGGSPSSVGGCPYIVWDLASSYVGDIHGMAYYSDLSGVSDVRGTVDSNGKLRLVLSQTDTGNGPVGTVDGAVAGGHLVGTLTGLGCANGKVDIRQVADINDIQNAIGGGQ